MIKNILSTFFLLFCKIFYKLLFVTAIFIRFFFNHFFFRIDFFSQLLVLLIFILSAEEKRGGDPNLILSYMIFFPELLIQKNLSAFKKKNKSLQINDLQKPISFKTASKTCIFFEIFINH